MLTPHPRNPPPRTRRHCRNGKPSPESPNQAPTARYAEQTAAVPRTEPDRRSDRASRPNQPRQPPDEPQPEDHTDGNPPPGGGPALATPGGSSGGTQSFVPGCGTLALVGGITGDRPRAPRRNDRGAGRPRSASGFSAATAGPEAGRGRRGGRTDRPVEAARRAAGADRRDSRRRRIGQRGIQSWPDGTRQPRGGRRPRRWLGRTAGHVGLLTPGSRRSARPCWPPRSFSPGLRRAPTWYSDCAVVARPDPPPGRPSPGARPTRPTRSSPPARPMPSARHAATEPSTGGGQLPARCDARPLFPGPQPPPAEPGNRPPGREPEHHRTRERTMQRNPARAPA